MQSIHLVSIMSKKNLSDLKNTIKNNLNKV